MPASHGLRSSVGTPGGEPDRRAASPLSLPWSVQWGGPGPAAPYRTDRRQRQLVGCGAVRAGPITMRRQLGWHRGAGSPATRGRDGLGDTGLSAATLFCSAVPRPPHGAGPFIHCCSRRANTRSSWGPARRSGPARAGPGLATHPRRERTHHYSPGHWPAHLGTRCPPRRCHIHAGVFQRKHHFFPAAKTPVRTSDTTVQ